MRFTSLICILLILSCTKKETPPEPTALSRESAAVVGDRVAGRLGAALKEALSAAMKSGGPREAISVCSKKAYALTDSIEKTDPDVVRLRRTSLRIRNPQNAPDSSEIAAISLFEARLNSGNGPGDPIITEEMSVNGKQFRYFKPLLVEPVCLVCHGTSDYLNKEVLAKIKAVYPDDRATGFNDGDLRGVISVVIRADGSGQDVPFSLPNSVR